jgi:TRAP-type C4-dicarboxylate transport system substrate-binding protein
VAPYITKVDLGAVFSGALAMNKKTFDGLPPHMKELFRELGRDYAKMCADLVAEREAAAWAALGKNPNVKIAELPQAERVKWAKALPDVAGDWARRNGEPGKQVLRIFMEEARKHGAKPLRDWDKGL